MKRWHPFAILFAFALCTTAASAQQWPHAQFTPNPNWTPNSNRQHGSWGGAHAQFTPNPNWSAHPRASFAPNQYGYNNGRWDNHGNDRAQQGDRWQRDDRRHDDHRWSPFNH